MDGGFEAGKVHFLGVKDDIFQLPPIAEKLIFDPLRAENFFSIFDYLANYLGKRWHFQPKWLPPEAEKSIFELFGWKEDKTMHFLG